MIRTSPRRFDHDVLRLQVAMDHAPVMRGGEAGADLARGVERLVGGQSADAREQRGEVFAIHVLHRDEGHPFDLADVVNAADVRMGTWRATRTSP